MKVSSVSLLLLLYPTNHNTRSATYLEGHCTQNDTQGVVAAATAAGSQVVWVWALL